MVLSEQEAAVKGTKSFGTDLSLWGLIGSNVFVIIFAVIQNWPFGWLMWVYWCQSVIIGIFWFLKMLTLRDFSVKGVEVNGRPVKATASTKIKMSFFFLFHYGFFHFVYLIFLVALVKLEDVSQILLMAAVFFMYQGFSFFYNRKWVEKSKPNIGTLFIFPYGRVLPMHLTIIFGNMISSSFSGRGGLLLFLLLKTLADIVMHIAENTGFSDKKKQK